MSNIDASTGISADHPYSIHVASFDFLKRCIRVTSDVLDPFDRIVNLWSSFQIDTDKHIPPAINYAIRTRFLNSSGFEYCLARNNEPRINSDDWEKIPVYIDSDIVTWLIERERNLILFHAAAASFDGHAIMIAGQTGSGKTTLMLGLIARGGLYLADELCPYDPDEGSMMSFHKGFILRPGTSMSLRRFASGENAILPRQDVPKSECVHLADLFPGQFSESSPISAIIFPHSQRGAATDITQLTKKDAFHHLIKNVWNLSLMKATAIAVLLEMASSIDCYHMTLGGVGNSVDLVMKHVMERMFRNQSVPGTHHLNRSANPNNGEE